MQLNLFTGLTPPDHIIERCTKVKHERKPIERININKIIKPYESNSNTE